MNDTRPHPPSLWWADPGPAFPSLTEELDADVAIIGGGITGITLARTLAEQDASVVVLEAGHLAGAASGRSAGLLVAMCSEPYAEGVAMWGRAGARALLETGRRSHQRVRALIETDGLECDYVSRGSYRLAQSEEEAEDLRASLPLLAADGFPMREVASIEAVPSPAAAARFAAAFEVNEDGELHPVRFLHGLARTAVKHGARLFEHSAVIGARWEGGLWETRTGNGRVRSRALVLASNAYAPQLCPGLASIIQPRRGQMISTAPIAHVISTRPVHTRWGHRYWRQLADGRLVIGGWRDVDPDAETGFDEQPTPRIQQAIEHGIADLAPEGVAIEHRWAGTMGFSRDGRPLVGWLDTQHHLAICAGFTGHGLGMAAACTLDLAQVLSFRRAPGIETFDPTRFRELRMTCDAMTALGAARG
jgi:glycine/D-amino acid oxidase-like deaminating enzyme